MLAPFVVVTRSFAATVARGPWSHPASRGTASPASLPADALGDLGRSRAFSACTSRGGLLADGHEVRTLDLAPLDDAELERSVEELRGDVRSAAGRARASSTEPDVLVHAAAALPIQVSRESIRSVNVGGTATLLAAAAEAGVRRHVLVSSTAVYGVPKVHPIYEDDAARRRRLPTASRRSRPRR